jgi:type VI secretion system secreted protein Hcp
MKQFAFGLMAAVLVSGSARAAEHVFCKIEGQKQGIIKGDSTVKGQEDSIPILSMASGVDIPFDPASGQATGRRQHKPLTIVKNLDKASPKLFLAAVTNENLKQVTCVFYQSTGGGVQQAFFRIQLQNARITETDIGGNALTSHGVHETVSMRFERITLEDIIGGVIAEDDALGGKEQ